MAKTKTSPQKGKKSAVAKAAPKAPRRSPRKAVQSAKKLAAEEDSAVEEATKPASTKKAAVAAKTTPKGAAKKVAGARVTKKSPSPSKATSSGVKRKVAAPKATKSASSKKDASPAKSEEPPTSAKRGRLKKVTGSTPTKSQTGPRSPSKVSSRTRSQTPDDADLNPGLGWTDSPKKRGPAKASNKKATTKAASAGKMGSQNATETEPMSVRKSIELPQAKSRSRFVSPARKASASPVRGRSNTAASSKARANSAVSDAGSARAQSRSPARKNSRTTETALAFSRRAAFSPTKDDLVSPRGRGGNRSQSPTKDPQTSPKRRGSSRSKSPTNQGAASPKRRAPSRSRSPTKSEQQRIPSVTEILSTVRNRSQSTNKTESRKASKKSSEDELLPSPVQSPRPRGRPRSSSLGRPPSPIQMNRPRASGSPVKETTKPASRSRSVSPKKSSAGAAPSRRLSDPRPARGRRRATSPLKGQGQKTKSSDISGDKAAAVARFKRDDEYGDQFRRLESIVYKTGVSPAKARFPLISDSDRLFAIQKGRNRAQLEKSLHAKGPLSKRPARKPTHVEIDEVDLSSSDELTTEYTRSRRNAVAQPEHPDRLQLSPQRRRASDTSQSSPKKGRPRSRSPSKTRNDSPPLPPGKPSGKGRGGITSVTNPQYIGDTKTKNPFWETMPGAEIWHRRMPSFLPFGETPFMERVMSNQITEDLAKGAEKSQGIASKISNWLSGGNKSPEIQARPYKSPWELPDVSDSEIDAAAKQLAHVINGQASPVSPKRKASEQLQRSPVKKARRHSQGNEPTMSGAL